MSEQDDRREPIEPPGPVLNYRSPQSYERPKPASFSFGCATAFLLTLVCLALGFSRAAPVAAVIALALLAFAIHNWAVSGSGKFLAGVIAGALILVGVAFLIVLAICGNWK